MWFGLMIISTVIVGFLAISLWMKEAYEKHNTGCETDGNNSVEDGSCSHCGIKDIANHYGKRRRLELLDKQK